MKKIKILRQLLVCLIIASLSFGELSALENQSVRENGESTPLFGQLANGMGYSIVPSDKLKGGVWLKLSCATPGLEEISLLSRLTLHALFYGTEHYNRQEIILKLNALGLDIEADAYLAFNPMAQSLQFSLPSADQELVRETLSLLNALMLHPTLENESIECARRRLIENGATESDLAFLRSITASELKAFHVEWFLPENMHLTLVGMNDASEALPLLANSFGAEIASTNAGMLQQHAELPLNQNSLDYFEEKIEWMSDHHCHVVDGKIWMQEPNWINKSTNGKSLGALLTLVGICGMVFVFPYFASAAIIAGGLSTGTGLYLVTSDYLKDPTYIESVRKTDLQYGCAYAYRKGRVGMTLTPYERRASFLQEMVDHPHKLPKLPILLLADLYHLNDPVIAEIFTVDEFNALTTLKRNFIQQRNQIKFAKESLEQELVAATAPYTLERDNSLLRVREFYSQNFYVVAKESYKLQRDASIADIEEAFKEHLITLEEKDNLIKKARLYYEESISSPDFQAGMNAANLYLAQAELEIQKNYDFQVEAAKQSIQYNYRMAYYNQGEQSLIVHFNHELRNLLVSFPVYATIFPDYLDLRDL